MIALTRLTGAQFALNPDLIERVDRTPDTVITLVDGTKYLVRESLDEVAELVIAYRATVLSVAGSLDVDSSSVRRNRLAAVAELSDPDPSAPAEAPVVPFNPRQA